LQSPWAWPLLPLLLPELALLPELLALVVELVLVELALVELALVALVEPPAEVAEVDELALVVLLVVVPAEEVELVVVPADEVELVVVPADEVVLVVLVVVPADEVELVVVEVNSVALALAIWVKTRRVSWRVTGRVEKKMNSSGTE
jgi:hypothetical protein